MYKNVNLCIDDKDDIWKFKTLDEKEKKMIWIVSFGVKNSTTSLDIF